jgi:hypothetical protein
MISYYLVHSPRHDSKLWDFTTTQNDFRIQNFVAIDKTLLRLYYHLNPSLKPCTKLNNKSTLKMVINNNNIIIIMGLLFKNPRYG